MYNLKGRHFLKELDFTDKELGYLLDLSRDLKRDAARRLLDGTRDPLGPAAQIVGRSGPAPGAGGGTGPTASAGRAGDRLGADRLHAGRWGAERLGAFRRGGGGCAGDQRGRSSGGD